MFTRQTLRARQKSSILAARDEDDLQHRRGPGHAGGLTFMPCDSDPFGFPGPKEATG